MGELRETICSASKALEIVALDIFAQNGWRSYNRLCFWFFSLYTHTSIPFFISLWAENIVNLGFVRLQRPETFLFSKKSLRDGTYSLRLVKNAIVFLGTQPKRPIASGPDVAGRLRRLLRRGRRRRASGRRGAVASTHRPIHRAAAEASVAFDVGGPCSSAYPAAACSQPVSPCCLVSLGFRF